MNPACRECQFPFHREGGFYLGAIYINYGLTALVVTVAYPLLTLTKTLSPRAGLAVCMSFAILFPIALFRHARGIWLGFDEFFDPQAK